MDPNDTVPSGTFSEEEKLPDGIDEDSSWFSKNLGDESDNTVEHDVEQEGISSQINQDELSQELTQVHDSSDQTTKPSEEPMETDSQSDLLAEITEKNQKKELTELKDIEINSKKHDISNELKEMFEEKSSDAEELPETSLTKHSLDTDITKEDKLKDIVPDDILGKDDSFDELDNDALHQELEAHLTYEKTEQLSELNSESSISHSQESENGNQKEAEAGSEITKLSELSFEGKTELLNDITEDIGTKEIDEIMQESTPTEEDASNKDISSEVKEEISKDLISDLKDDLENQLENITGDQNEKSEQAEVRTENENIGNPVDKESIELNQENMMVEFAHGSGNQVLIQINTDKTETNVEDTLVKSEGIVMETSDGQTLVFSSSDAVEPDVSSQVEGGEEFLQAVTGKLEDVLATEPEKEEPASQSATTPPAQATLTPTVDKKEPVKESPKCCVPTCKSGKSGLKTTYRYFKPPVNKILYKKWEYIFHQAKQEITPDSLICELHFRTGLIYKRGLDKFGKIIWALRDGALPKLSPSGVMRLGGVPPSTTVQVPKKQDSLIKTPTTQAKTVSPSATAAKPVSPAAGSFGTPKVLGKKILQKPVKTVATKVSNEVTDIGFLYKNPELVKGKKLIAQDELANLDVLVCGECHSVFHILELFQAHKLAANCKGESNFKGNPAEPKPQVWAFLLWKSAQAKVSDVESSWRLYQRWCKMDERIRNVWISAGKSLQEGNAIASLKLIDTPPPKTYQKPGRPPLKRDSDDEEISARKPVKRKPGRPPGSGSLSTPEPEIADIGGAGDHVPEPMEVDPSEISPNKPTGDIEVDQTLDSINRRTPELITSEVEIKQEVVSDEDHDENKENNSRRNFGSDEIQNCDKCQKPIINPKGGVLCAGGCYGYYHVECTRLKTHQAFSKLGVRKAHWKCDFCKAAEMDQTPKAQKSVAVKQRQPEKPHGSSGKTEEEEFVVEKIVSRRYNIKKKHYEYLLKWEGYPSEQNTWEPAENLGTCQHLLKAFEEALAKQQAAKQAGLARQSGGPSRQETPYRIKPPVVPNKRPPPTSTPITTSTGRPQRSSKKKAMDQVKQWCGSIVKPSDDDVVGMKRKLSESDSEYDGDEELVIKKVKVEMESEGSDSDGFKLSLGRPRGRPPLATTPRGIGNQQINGENLAAELGLESEEEDNPAVSPSQKSSLVRKMSSLSPSKQQVLVASAKGVVTVDQKQIPNLSSGVYIMSNKSGIVKVDNNKSLSTLQKSGVLKKPLTQVKTEKMDEDSSPQKLNSGVVVLPRSEAGTLQQKVGVIRKTSAPTSTTQNPTSSATSPSTPKPAGLLKPLKPGLTPRPMGLLRPTTTPPVRPQSQTPNANTKVQPLLKPRLATPGRGRPPISPLVKRPLVPEGGLQATPQQKLLVAKKKAESENDVRPAVTASPAPRPLLKPKIEPGVAIPPIRSTNKPLAHPLLSRGRGRGYRGRGRGSSLSQMLHVREREREPEPEPVRESRLVDSDNLLMEFQEPSDSEESDDGLEDIFPNLEELPPIEPESPPRPLSLCPETGKVLCKAEGEKTPEPTPPPSPTPPTPPPAPSPPPVIQEPTHILPEIETEPEPEPVPEPEVISAPVTAPVSVSVTTPTPRSKKTSTAIVKQDGMICKVEMSPGGTTGTLVEAVSEAAATPPGVTEGTVTIKKPLASRNRNLNRGPQLSVVPNTSSTSLGTITVPARKLFQEDNTDDMVTITGEDGLVYQVSNSELAGNTLLVSSEDGEQQCVYVTTGEDGSEGTILTLDSAYADAVAQLGSDQVNILSTEDGDQYFIKEDDGVEGGEMMTLEGEDGLVAGDDQSGQVVAQLVEAGEPAPGGSRRVVLLLPDGNLMMTEVDEEQYAALDLDK